MSALLSQKTAVSSGTFRAAIRAEEPDSRCWNGLLITRK